MKKLLGVSIVAMLAVTPMMAHAVGSAPTAATTSSEPYLGVDVATTDQGHIASTAYVKGAYNAAIGAVNAVSAAKQNNLMNNAASPVAVSSTVKTSVGAATGENAADNTSLVTEKAVRDAIDAIEGADAITAGPGVSKTNNKISVDLTSNGGLQTTGEGDAATLGVKVNTGTMEVGADGVGIKAGGVGTTQLADNAVTTAKILDANVTANKLATDSVTTAKIADGNVTTAKLDASAVTTAKIADANVTTGKLADSAVETAKIANGAVTYSKLDSDLVQTSVRSSVDSNAEGYSAWNSDQTVASEKAVATAISTATTGMATQTGVNSAIAASSVSVTSATVDVYNAWGAETTTPVNANVTVDFTAGTYPNN